MVRVNYCQIGGLELGFPVIKIVSFTFNKTVGLAGLINGPEILTKL